MGSTGQRILPSLRLLSTEAPHTFVSNPLHRILSCSPPPCCKSAYFQVQLQQQWSAAKLLQTFFCCTELKTPSTPHNKNMNSYKCRSRNILVQAILQKQVYQKNNALHTFMSPSSAALLSESVSHTSMPTPLLNSYTRAKRCLMCT